MPSISTYARPVSNQVTIDIPQEYASCSFEILLMPVRHESKKMGFVELTGASLRLWPIMELVFFLFHKLLQRTQHLLAYVMKIAIKP